MVACPVNVSSELARSDWLTKFAYVCRSCSNGARHDLILLVRVRKKVKKSTIAFNFVAFKAYQQNKYKS